MKRKLLATVSVSLCLLLSACGGGGNDSIQQEKVTDTQQEDKGTEKSNKGTKENPYTMEDTITITCYAWEGNRILGGTVIGSNTFELSNFRIEVGNLSSYNNAEDVKVLVFDNKCIETCYENGLGWLDTGDIFVDNFFNDNMQTIDFTNITEIYTSIKRQNVVYFKGTTYTEAYAMCKIDNTEIINSDETYNLMRITYYDENLDEQYIYIELDNKSEQEIYEKQTENISETRNTSYENAIIAEEKGYYTIAMNLFSKTLEYQNSQEHYNKLKDILSEYNGIYYGESTQYKNVNVYLYIENGNVTAQFEGQDKSPDKYELYSYGETEDNAEILAFAPSRTDLFSINADTSYGDGFAIQKLDDGSYLVAATQGSTSYSWNGFYKKISDTIE